MFQVIAKRDDVVGYHIFLSDIPDELSKDSIVFMPELATKEHPHLKYISKYTHESGNIIVKLVRSDGFDQYGRPTSLSHSLIIPSEEYNLNSLSFYSSPLIHTNLFDDINEEPGLLDDSAFHKSKNEILDKIELKTLRELVVAAMVEPQVIVQPDLELSDLIDLASLVDKAIPFEASYDFSLISYSDKNCNEFLVHNLLYFFPKEEEYLEKVKISNLQAQISRIAEEEEKYLDWYIYLIVREEYEKLLKEHANWVIGKYYDEHKELQKLFTRRYQLDIPFSRRNKFHAQLVKSLSLFYT